MKTATIKLLGWVQWAAALYGIALCLYLGAMSHNGHGVAREMMTPPRALPGGMWFLHVGIAAVVWWLATAALKKLVGHTGRDRHRHR